MKKILAMVSLILFSFGICFLGGCGDPYAGVGLSLVGFKEGESVELVMDENGEAQREVFVKIENFVPAIVGSINFSPRLGANDIVSCTGIKKAEGGMVGVTINALRGGKTTVKASLDGEVDFVFDVTVKKPVKDIIFSKTYLPFVVKGEDFKKFDVSKLLNFEPLDTTEREVIFKIDGQEVGGISVLDTETRREIEVVCESKTNPQIFKKFDVRVIDPIKSVTFKENDKEISNLELVLNSSMNQRTVLVEVETNEPNLIFDQMIGQSGESAKAFKTKIDYLSFANGKHIFSIEFSGLKAISGSERFEISFSVAGGYSFSVKKRLDVNVIAIPQSITINGESENLTKLTVFNFNSSYFKGTPLNIQMFPTYSKFSKVKITYNEAYVNLFLENGDRLASGAVIESFSKLFVKGVDMVVTEPSAPTEILIEAVIPKEYNREVKQIVLVDVLSGAKKIESKDNLCLTLQSDGSASVTPVLFEFDVLPAGSYVGNVLLSGHSSNVSLVQSSVQNNLIQIFALGAGESKFDIVLPNGLTKTISYKVISPLKEDSLIVDAPSGLESKFVGDKNPLAVGRETPLLSVAIHKSIVNEKGVRLKVSHYPENASFENVTYSVKTGANFLIVQNSMLIGREEGRARVSAKFEYLVLVSGVFEKREQIFEFDVDVYVPIENFYFSTNHISVADFNTVGVFKKDEATKFIVPNIYPLNATNGKAANIEYEVSGGGKPDKDGIISNEFLSFNPKTGEIVGRLTASVSNPTIITAKITDLNNVFKINITVEVILFEKVAEIVVDNIVNLKEDSIVLSAGNPNFQILARTVAVTAHNKKIKYDFMPLNAESVGAIEVSADGLVSLALSASELIGKNNIEGFIRLSSEDSYLSDTVTPTWYEEVRVIVSLGTNQNPYIIKTKEEFMKIGTPIGLSRHYLICGTINLENEPIVPFGEFSGSMKQFGAGSGRIIGINLTKDNNSKVGLFEKVSGTISGISFEGKINYSGAAEQIGLICAENIGTIEDCSVSIQSSKVMSTNGHAAISVFVGKNSGTISFNYKNIDGSAFVLMNGGSNFEVVGDGCFVGSVCGDNSGTISCLDPLLSNGYVAIVNISALSSSALGGLVGKNSGGISFAKVSGIVRGAENVGGLVGSMSAGGVAKCESDVSAYGTVNVGGFVGICDSTARISSCSANLYANSSLGADRAFLAVGTSEVGGFVGLLKSGTIASCYVSNFNIANKVNIIKLNNTEVSATAGAFVGKIVGGTLSQVWSNAEIVAGMGFVKGQHSQDSSIAPAIPTSLEIQILKNKMTDLNEVSTRKVMFFEFSEAINKTFQYKLKNYNMLKIDEFVKCNTTYSLSSENPDIIKIDDNGEIEVLKTGFAKLVFKALKNELLTNELTVYVINKIPDYRLAIRYLDSNIFINENSLLSLRKDEYFSLQKVFSKCSRKIADGSEIAIVGEKTVDIKSMSQYVSVSNYEQVLSIMAKQVITEKDEKTTFKAFLQVEQMGVKFVCDILSDFEVVTNIRCVEGTKSIRTDFDEVVIAPMDKLQIKLFVSTDDAAESLTVSADKNVLLNGVRAEEGAKTQIILSEIFGGVVEFSFEIFDKSKIGDYEIVVTDRNNLFRKVIKVTVIAQKIEFLTVDVYDDINKSSQKFETSSNVIPGKPGLLKIDIQPNFSKCEYIKIENFQNAHNINFELVSRMADGTYQRKEGALYVENGILIPFDKMTNKNGLLDTVYVKTLMSTAASDNEKITINILSNDGLISSKVLFTRHEAGVKLSVKGNYGNVAGEEIFLARGLSYDVKSEIHGFEENEIIYELSDTNNLLFSKNGGKMQIKGLKNGAYSIFAHGEKNVNGIVYKSPIVSLPFKIVDFVLNDLDFAYSTNIDDFEVIKCALNGRVDLKFQLQLGPSIEYNDNDSEIVKRVKAFFEILNSTETPANKVKFEYSLNGTTWEPFVDKDLGDFEILGRKVLAKKLYSYENSPYFFRSVLNFKYDENGKIEFSDIAGKEYLSISERIKIDVYSFNSKASSIPIKTYEEFVAMEDGFFYTLVDDITLSETFKPISAKIAGFDGNFHKITFKAASLDNKLQESVNYGLFESIDAGVVVSNINLHINTLQIGFATSILNFGMIAGENNGVVTNCSVKGNELNVALTEKSDGTSIFAIGGVVGKNNGYVTNCRFEVGKLVAKGKMAGLVCVNRGFISNSYVKKCNIVNLTNNVKTETAGLVASNENDSKIMGCYVEGVKNELTGSVNSNNINCSITSDKKVSGFVFNNKGKISNCYSDIPIISGSIVSGFVYKNEDSGEISNSYSICMLQNGRGNNFPFIVDNDESRPGGKIESCYFVKSLNAWNTLNLKVAGLTILDDIKDGKTGIERLGDKNTFPTFGFGEGRDEDKAVWKMRAGKPYLISANNVISASKKYVGSVLDPVTNLISYSYEAVSGTKEDPFIITSAKEFEKTFATASTNKICDKYFRIVSDIDYEDANGENIVTNLFRYTFTGEIEGNGLSIKNFILNTDEKLENGGFFGVIGSETASAVIKDLNFEPRQVNFSSTENVGVVCGKMIGSGLFGVSVNGFKTNSAGLVVKGKTKVGGLVGFMTNSMNFVSKLINSTAEIIVNATAMEQTSDAGFKDSTGIYLTDEIIVNIDKVAFSGAIAGFVKGGDINYSKVNGNSASISQIAGIAVGNLGRSSTINNLIVNVGAKQYVRACYAAGGVVGLNSGTVKDVSISNDNGQYFKDAPIAPVFVGGIVGINSGTICGKTKDPIVVPFTIASPNFKYVGGIVGRFEEGKIENIEVASTKLQTGQSVGIYFGQYIGGNGGSEIFGCKMHESIGVENQLTFIADGKNAGIEGFNNGEDNIEDITKIHLEYGKSLFGLTPKHEKDTKEITYPKETEQKWIKVIKYSY